MLYIFVCIFISTDMSAVVSAHWEIYWFSSLPPWLGNEVCILDPIHYIGWCHLWHSLESMEFLSMPGSLNGKSENNSEVCVQTWHSAMGSTGQSLSLTFRPFSLNLCFPFSMSWEYSEIFKWERREEGMYKDNNQVSAVRHSL